MCSVEEILKVSGDGEEHQRSQEKERDDGKDKVSEWMWGEALRGDNYLLYVCDEYSSYVNKMQYLI